MLMLLLLLMLMLRNVLVQISKLEFGHNISRLKFGPVVFELIFCSDFSGFEVEAWSRS